MTTARLKQSGTVSSRNDRLMIRVIILVRSGRNSLNIHVGSGSKSHVFDRMCKTRVFTSSTEVLAKQSRRSPLNSISASNSRFSTVSQRFSSFNAFLMVCGLMLVLCFPYCLCYAFLMVCLWLMDPLHVTVDWSREELLVATAVTTSRRQVAPAVAAPLAALPAASDCCSSWGS